MYDSCLHCLVLVSLNMNYIEAMQQQNVMVTYKFMTQSHFHDNNKRGRVNRIIIVFIVFKIALKISCTLAYQIKIDLNNFKSFQNDTVYQPIDL